MHGVYGPDPETGGQDAVEGGGGAAPLDVAQDGGPGLETGPVLDLLGQQVADTTQSDMAELVELARSRH